MSADPYLPRYRRIELALRVAIAALRPGDQLPSDAALCARFQVSRMTVRHAVEKLVEEGLVQRDPGRGTYVAQPPAHRRANTLMNFTSEMHRRGRRPRSRVIERGLREPTADEAAALRLAPGDQVVSLVRIRFADDRAVALEHAALHPRAAEAVLSADLADGSLHETLRAAGLVPTRGTGTVAAEAAGDEDSRLLGMRGGDPLLVERRVILDQRGRPLEVTESRYPADRYALDVAFDVEKAVEASGPDVTFRPASPAATPGTPAMTRAAISGREASS